LNQVLALRYARTDVVEAEIFTYAAPPSARVGGWGYPTPPVEAVDFGQGPFAIIPLVDQAGKTVTLPLTPHEVVTLRLKLPPPRGEPVLLADYHLLAEECYSRTLP
jgi:hypothetical protein